MPILHESIQRLLGEATLRGRAATTEDLGPAILVTIRRLKRGAGLHDWKLDAVITRDAEEFSTVFNARIRWAGSTPVVTVEETEVEGLGRIAGKFIIHDGRFAGMIQLNGAEAFSFGSIQHDETLPPRPRYVIERSSEFLREWWTGREWTEDNLQAHWYVREPDGPRETGDEEAHAVYYRSGTVDAG